MVLTVFIWWYLKNVKLVLPIFLKADVVLHTFFQEFRKLQAQSQKGFRKPQIPILKGSEGRVENYRQMSSESFQWLSETRSCGYQLLSETLLWQHQRLLGNSAGMSIFFLGAVLKNIFLISQELWSENLTTTLVIHEVQIYLVYSRTLPEIQCLVNVPLINHEVQIYLV